MDRNRVLTAVHTPLLRVSFLAIALYDTNDGHTQVVHQAQEASIKVVVKLVRVNTFKQKGVSGLGHLVLYTALHRDSSRRTRNFL
jgi:hypothetical protein